MPEMPNIEMPWDNMPSLEEIMEDCMNWAKDMVLDMFASDAISMPDINLEGIQTYDNWF